MMEIFVQTLTVKTGNIILDPNKDIKSIKKKNSKKELNYVFNP